MTPTTLKAARAGLGWTQNRLATEAKIHGKTVAYYERKAALPEAPEPAGAIPKMIEAFARHGVTISGQTVTFSQPPNS